MVAEIVGRRAYISRLELPGFIVDSANGSDVEMEVERERVFAALLGVYAGCLIGPAGAIALPGPPWPVLVVGFAAAATAGYSLARRLDLAVNLTGVWQNLSIIVFPFVYLPRLVFRPPGLSPVEFFATPATVGLAALLPGLGVIVLGDLHRNRTKLEQATVHAEFEARSAPRSRTLQKAGAVLVVLSAFGGGLLFFLADGNLDSGSLVAYVAAAMGGLTPLLASDDDREIAVTDAGLKVQMQVHDWDTFTDYEVTDDALVLERPKRWHATFKFDREDVENLPEVEEALKRYLPRE
jgi:hypothetical protein